MCLFQNILSRMWKTVQTLIRQLHSRSDLGLHYLHIPFFANELDPEVIKLFSCSTQLSMKFSLLIYIKLLTIANCFLLNIAEHELFSAHKYKNANIFTFISREKFMLS